MGEVLLAYVIPAGVTLYGVVVLLTGEVGGFGTRSVSGVRARVLGALLVAALPVTIVVGPLVRIQPVAPKLDLDSHRRDIEITREILEQRRQLQDWREKNIPDPKDEPADVEPVRERLRAFHEFNARYDQRAAESDGRVRALQEEQSRLRGQREDKRRQQVEAAGRSGALWISLGIMLVVWSLAWLVGRPSAANASSAEERPVASDRRPGTEPDAAPAPAREMNSGSS